MSLCEPYDCLIVTSYVMVHVSSSVSVYSPVCQLVPVSLQNALIRELEHTKKLIEESHHEKVRDYIIQLYNSNKKLLLLGLLIMSIYPL